MIFTESTKGKKKRRRSFGAFFRRSARLFLPTYSAVSFSASLSKANLKWHFQCSLLSEFHHVKSPRFIQFAFPVLLFVLAAWPKYTDSRWHGGFASTSCWRRSIASDDQPRGSAHPLVGKVCQRTAHKRPGNSFEQRKIPTLSVELH